MSLLTVQENMVFDSLSSQLVQDNDVVFAGFLSNKGRMISYKSAIYNDEKNLEIFLMETALEFSMKKEFDDTFGPVEYVITRREKINVVCIPIHDVYLVIGVNNSASQDRVMSMIFSLVSKLIHPAKSVNMT